MDLGFEELRLATKLCEALVCEVGRVGKSPSCSRSASSRSFRFARGSAAFESRLLTPKSQPSRGVAALLERTGRAGESLWTEDVTALQGLHAKTDTEAFAALLEKATRVGEPVPHQVSSAGESPIFSQ